MPAEACRPLQVREGAVGPLVFEFAAVQVWAVRHRSRRRHLDRLAVIVHHVLLRRLVEPLLRQPGPMGRTPGRLALEPAAVTQQELRQLMACRFLGVFGVIAGPLQVADGLSDRVQDVDGGQVPRAKEVGEIAGVAPVRLAIPDWLSCRANPSPVGPAS